MSSSDLRANCKPSPGLNIERRRRMGAARGRARLGRSRSAICTAPHRAHPLGRDLVHHSSSLMQQISGCGAPWSSLPTALAPVHGPTYSNDGVSANTVCFASPPRDSLTAASSQERLLPCPRRIFSFFQQQPIPQPFASILFWRGSAYVSPAARHPKAASCCLHKVCGYSHSSPSNRDSSRCPDGRLRALWHVGGHNPRNMADSSSAKNKDAA